MENSGGIESSGAKHDYIQARSQTSAMGLFRGSRGTAQALKNFVFFCKNSLVLGLF